MIRPAVPIATLLYAAVAPRCAEKISLAEMTKLACNSSSISPSHV